MGGHTIYGLEHNTGSRGIITTVTQSVDLTYLSEKELRRVINTAKRGRITRTGYVADIIRACAKHLRVPIPMCLEMWGSTASIQHCPRYDDAFAELIQLSDVRMRLWVSRNPDTWEARRFSEAGDTSGFNHRDTLTLRGWELGDRAALDHELRKVISTIPDYAEGLDKLVAFIATRPSFDVRTKRY